MVPKRERESSHNIEHTHTNAIWFTMFSCSMCLLFISVLMLILLCTLTVTHYNQNESEQDQKVPQGNTANRFKQNMNTMTLFGFRKTTQIWWKALPLCRVMFVALCLIHFLTFSLFFIFSATRMFNLFSVFNKLCVGQQTTKSSRK